MLRTADQEVAEGDILTLEFTRTVGDQTEALTIPLTVSGTAQLKIMMFHPMWNLPQAHPQPV